MQKNPPQRSIPDAADHNGQRPTRRTVLRAARALSLGAVAAGLAAAPRAKQPNILFILADDMGYADLSCYGRRDYTTPHLDQLASDGVRLTEAYANSAVCSATRTALITGRYQDRLAIGLEEPLTTRDVGLPPEHPTLPSLLRAAGYSTTLVGKWHLGALPRFGPLQSGYEHFFGFRSGAVDYFTHRNGTNPDLWDQNQRIDRIGYLTDLLGGAASTAIEGAAAAHKPFFLSLHFSAPHWPWEGPDDLTESKRLAPSSDPRRLQSYDAGTAATYAAMVKRMDDQIGKVLATIDRLGLRNDTIVVFTSDNGGERFSDTWPFSGHKTELLEGGIRIPAIVRWPGRLPRGAVSDQVAMSMDWLPTLLSAAVVTPSALLPPDGIDLLPMLTKNKPLVDRILCWRYLNRAQEACRSGRWKYLKILENQFLFDVVVDPLERANLKDREPQRFREVVASYRAWDAQMLPLDPQSSTSGPTGAELADHFGVREGRQVVPLASH